MDPRHIQRLKTVQNLYAFSYGDLKKNLPEPNDSKTKLIIEHLTSIDPLIERHAQKFPLEKISKTDLAILRLSIYDLLIDRKMPEKVVINEAVELAKELSGEKSYAFINAVLGQILIEFKKHD